jgi:hypothetical protein
MEDNTAEKRIKVERRKRTDYKAKYLTMRGWVVVLSIGMFLWMVGFIAGAR